MTYMYHQQLDKLIYVVRNGHQIILFTTDL
jgi:hypothetical protein